MIKIAGVALRRQFTKRAKPLDEVADLIDDRGRRLEVVLVCKGSYPGTHYYALSVALEDGRYMRSPPWALRGLKEGPIKHRVEQLISKHRENK